MRANQIQYKINKGILKLAHEIAQTFRKDTGAFVDITDPIVAPAAGSRMATVALPQGVKKMKANAVNKARRFYPSLTQ